MHYAFYLKNQQQKEYSPQKIWANPRFCKSELALIDWGGWLILSDLLNEWDTKDVASDPRDFSGQEEQFSRRPFEVAHYLAYTSCID